MAAEHVKRVRALLPGQEEAAQQTIMSVPAEPAKPLVPTVKEFHLVYLESERLSVKPSTIRTKESDFRNQIVPRLGHLRLDEVTYAVIEDFKLAIAQSQALNIKHKPNLLSPKTIHNMLVHVSDASSRPARASPTQRSSRTRSAVRWERRCTGPDLQRVVIVRDRLCASR
jgi:hypothetical protein